MLLSDVEYLYVARFCEAKQDPPCHLQCSKHGVERGKPIGDGFQAPIRYKVALAGLGSGDRAADVAPFLDAGGEMKVDEDPGLLPKVVRTFCCPLATNPLAGLPRHGAPLAEVQRLQQNADKFCELLKTMISNVEKMNARVGDLNHKEEQGRDQSSRRERERAGVVEGDASAVCAHQLQRKNH